MLTFGTKETIAMPLEILVLILVVVIGAAGATILLAATVLAALNFPFAWFGLLPAALAGYLAYRVLAERVGDAEEDHYDRMDH
jgi:hypothetical protein